MIFHEWLDWKMKTMIPKQNVALFRVLLCNTLLSATKTKIGATSAQGILVIFIRTSNYDFFWLQSLS